MRNKETLHNLQFAFAIPLVVALIAVLPIYSFEFYMFVRWVLFSGFVLSFLLYYINSDLALMGILSMIGAFDFNPFHINTSTKSWWIIADLVSAAFFAGLIYLCKKEIEDIERDEKLEASRPKVSKAEVARRGKVWQQKHNEEDQSALAWREKHNVSEERLAEMAKDPMQYNNPSFFTREERERNQKAISQRDNLIVVGVIAFIIAIIVIVHIAHNR